MKKLCLIPSFILLVLKPALAVSSEQDYHVFDKLLHGTYSCIRNTVEPASTKCYIVDQYIHLSGWVREGSEEVPADISETTVFSEISAQFYLHSSTIEETYYLKECSRGMSLVKSNPNKWDLKVGINSTGILTYCEAVNQSLVQQFYAEQ